jgi:integrase
MASKKQQAAAPVEGADQPKKRTGQKRGSGEGHIRQRQNGLWEASVRVTDPADTSKQKRVSVYGRTQAEVVQKLENVRHQKRHSPQSLVAADSVAGYLQRWLADDVALNKSFKTFEEYEGAVRLFVLPHLGSMKLAALSGAKLQQWQASLARKGVSANSRLRSIRVLRCALNKAVRLRLLPFNPMAAVEKPRVIREERKPLEPEQCTALFAACRQHRLGDLIVLAAMTGLRKGELFALEWSAVNLAEGVLVVRRSLEESGGGRKLKEPKTAAGRRVVSLGAEAVQALQSRLDKAKAEGMEPDVVPIVFPSTTGTHLLQSNFDRNVWYPIRQAAGIPDTFVFHDLRHTQASLLLAAGVDLKVIQKRLGHRDFATTANTYSHLLAGAQHDAVLKVDELLKRAKNSD